MHMKLFVAVAAVLVSAGAAFAAGPALYKTQDCSKMSVQMELNQCAGSNADAADKALNAIYKQLLKQHPDASSAAGLKESERAWMDYRDKECAREIGPQSDGGSIW